MYRSSGLTGRAKGESLDVLYGTGEQANDMPSTTKSVQSNPAALETEASTLTRPANAILTDRPGLPP